MDEETKRKNRLALMQLDTDMDQLNEKEETKVDGRSMAEVLRQKREATEKIVEESKTNK